MIVLVNRSGGVIVIINHLWAVMTVFNRFAVLLIPSLIIVSRLMVVGRRVMFLLDVFTRDVVIIPIFPAVSP